MATGTKQVYIEDGFVILNVHSEYSIALNSIQTPLQLLGWVSHLCEKSWIETEHIDSVISLVCDHKSWKLHG